jgi:hypothetical protein
MHVVSVLLCARPSLDAKAVESNQGEGCRHDRATLFQMLCTARDRVPVGRVGVAAGLNGGNLQGVANIVHTKVSTAGVMRHRGETRNVLK